MLRRRTDLVVFGFAVGVDKLQIILVRLKRQLVERQNLRPDQLVLLQDLLRADRLGYLESDKYMLLDIEDTDAVELYEEETGWTVEGSDTMKLNDATFYVVPVIQSKNAKVIHMLVGYRGNIELAERFANQEKTGRGAENEIMEALDKINKEW